MPDLIAQGPLPEQRWRRKLVERHSFILGRDAGAWSVPWDEHISRRHAQVDYSSGTLSVSKLSEARNAIFFGGNPVAQCTLRPGQHFVIGSTRFALAEELPSLMAASPPMTEHTFAADHLRAAQFRDAAHRIDGLVRLPEIIGGDVSDEELCPRLVSFLLAGITKANWAAVVACRGDREPDIQVLHWDHRRDTEETVSFSRRLVCQAVSAGTTVAHVWDASVDRAIQPTLSAEGTWAFCTPLRRPTSQGWCLYIAGRVEHQGPGARDLADLQDDVKFTELVADTVARLRELSRLERRQSALSQFISRTVLDRLGEEGPERLLEPREADVSVLFCDLRGFSRVSEQSSQDLMGLLERVSRALGVMTRQILDGGGVIGDFHGDAAMGFWGWPLDQPDRTTRACQAALGICDDFQSAAARNDHVLSGFRIGIGIASGRAVAGSIGTADQVKITVFGPVVNLAARLQEMTKQLRAPILVDQATAEIVRREVPRDICRVRRVARVRPRGLTTPVEVSQLLPPASCGGAISDEHIAAYEASLDALTQGDWDRAFSLLHQVPSEDRVKDFLTVFVAQHHRVPPSNWDGVIDLTAVGH